jgi:dihydroorotate dehydrogenase (NAD+) catalytic subunit
MQKHDFWIDPPVMNAAGSLGFAPDWRSRKDWGRFGVFVTNPISLTRRSPSQGRRYAPFAGGFVLHTGYPNPGFNAALRRFAPAWARSDLPVIVHLLAQDAEEVSQMAPRLEGREGVIGIELGLPPGIDRNAMRRMLAAASGELLVVARLPFEQALELAPAAAEAGAAAVSLSPPRGSLPAPDGKRIEGRLYGPAVLPFALQAVLALADLGLPILAAGGIYSEEAIRAFIDAGAVAVQLDSWLWLE